MARQIVVELVGDNKKFDKSMGAATGKLSGFQGQFKQSVLAGVGMGGGIAAFGMLTKGIGAVVGAVGDAVGALMRIERINAQTEAVIRSTGEAANVTAKEVENYAGAIESATGVEAESIQEGANLLLTFKNIRNEVGEGNDVFNQATDAMVDMSVAMGTDAKSGAMQLGKALNDPIAGLAALSRVGITFTDVQEDMIRSMVEAGDVMGAQKLMLEELESQFGGSAEAFGNTMAGKMAKFEHWWTGTLEGLVLDAVDFAEGVGEVTTAVGLHFGDLGDRANAMADRFNTDFDDIRTQTTARMRETGEGVDEALSAVEARFLEALDLVEGEVERLPEGLRLVSYNSWRAMELEFMAGQGPVATAVGGYPEGAADELLKNQFHLTDATTQLLKFMEEALSPGQEIFNAMMFLNGQAAADGLASSNPLVVRKTEELVAEAEAVLQQFDAYGPGFKVGTSFADGMKASQGYVRTASGQLAAAAMGQIGINSEPKDHDSPLYGITKWGGNIVKTIAQGIEANVPLAHAAAAALASGLVPPVPGLTAPALDQYTPPARMRVPEGGEAVRMGGGDINVNVDFSNFGSLTDRELQQRIHDTITQAMRAAYRKEGLY